MVVAEKKICSILDQVETDRNNGDFESNRENVDVLLKSVLYLKPDYNMLEIWVYLEHYFPRTIAKMVMMDFISEHYQLMISWLTVERIPNCFYTFFRHEINTSRSPFNCCKLSTYHYRYTDFYAEEVLKKGISNDKIHNFVYMTAIIKETCLPDLFLLIINNVQTSPILCGVRRSGPMVYSVNFDDNDSDTMLFLTRSGGIYRVTVSMLLNIHLLDRIPSSNLTTRNLYFG